MQIKGEFNRSIRQKLPIVLWCLIALIAATMMSNFFGRAGLSWQDKRKAVFAGTWYESDPNRLQSQLKQFIGDADKHLTQSSFDKSFAPNAAIDGAVLAIVAPHAGYVFSGPTAAYSYDAAVKSRKVDRIFLLGPSHYIGFDGIALPAERAFATPLGDLALDTGVIEELQGYPIFHITPEVHRREHSLEMQLPFIKESFGDVKIVPMLVGQLHDASEIRLAAHILQRYLKPDDLIVVSSDFTHYGPRYQYEPEHGNVRKSVRKLDEEAFSYLAKGDLIGFLRFKERTQDTICGFYPCALMLATLPEGSHATLLNYRTSQDSIAEDEQNSVSYMALAFSNPQDKKGWPEPGNGGADNLDLTDEEKQTLLEIARRALDEFVRNNHELTESEVRSELTPIMKKPMGAFVTLYKRGVPSTAHGDKELRGCIGYIWPVKPLFQSVIDNAIAAASRDYRFSRVKPDELRGLQIDINVLTPPKRISSSSEIKLGTDGIILYKGGKQSVFLPSVATEFGWNLDQTLSQLALKAGCPADAWKKDAQFDVFQSLSFEEH